MAESIVVPDLWTGHCQCGDHAYEASGIPNDPHLCSCEHCTRLSGAPADGVGRIPQGRSEVDGPGR